MPAKPLEEWIGDSRKSLLLVKEAIATLARTEAGPKSRRLIQDALRYESGTNLFWRVFDLPIMVESTKGATLTDVDGKTYIDCVAGFGTYNVGEGRKEILDVMKTQLDSVVTWCEMPNETRLALAKKLTEIAPIEGKSKVQFAGTGTEAVNGAVNIARYYTGKRYVMAFLGAYHGRSDPAASLTCDGHFRDYSYPWSSQQGVVHVPYAYCYRCVFGKEYPDCKMFCVQYIEHLLSNSQYSLRDHRHDINHVGVMIAEPMQGHAGFVRIPPKEFLLGLRKLCDEYGMLLVDDEVYTGFGKTGFLWAIERSGVKADVVSMGKSMAAGLTASAILGKEEIMDSSGPGAWGGTFVGSLIACAAALKVIEIIEKEKLIVRARQMGEYFLRGLKELEQKHRLIGNVQGSGLWLGVEFVKDRKAKEPAYDETRLIQKEAKKNGLLMTVGAFGNSLNIGPPIVISKEEIDSALVMLDSSISKVEKIR